MPSTAGTARRWRGGPGAGKQATGECNWAHHGVIGGGSAARGVASKRRRRHRGNTAAAVRSSARGRARLSNVWRTGLQCDLGEVLRVPIGLESKWRHGLGRDCPVAAAGARTPAS
jgi:hypothetical protein